MTQDEIEARGEFTPRTQGEIDRNLFAARTGGLVTLSAGAAWELIYAAQAWHRHVKAQRMTASQACDMIAAALLKGVPPLHPPPREGESFTVESSPIAPQARDTETCAHLRTAPVMGGPPEPSGGQPMRCLDCGMDFVLLPQARDTTPSEEA